MPQIENLPWHTGAEAWDDQWSRFELEVFGETPAEAVERYTEGACADSFDDEVAQRASAVAAHRRDFSAHPLDPKVGALWADALADFAQAVFDSRGATAAARKELNQRTIKAVDIAERLGYGEPAQPDSLVVDSIALLEIESSAVQADLRARNQVCHAADGALVEVARGRYEAAVKAGFSDDIVDAAAHYAAELAFYARARKVVSERHGGPNARAAIKGFDEAARDAKQIGRNVAHIAPTLPEKRLRQALRVFDGEVAALRERLQTLRALQ